MSTRLTHHWGPREMRVPVTPPFSDLPAGIRSNYYDYTVGPDGERQRRKQWVTQAPPQQQLRVAVDVLLDQDQLANIAARSSTNRSGTSVRGPVRASGGKVVDLGLSPSYIASKARRAANTSNHRTTDGPVHVKVKLLEQPTPAPAFCGNCKRSVAEHERVEETRHGTRNPATDLWDPEYPYTVTLYFCPVENDS